MGTNKRWRLLADQPRKHSWNKRPCSHSRKWWCMRHTNVNQESPSWGTPSSCWKRSFSYQEVIGKLITSHTLFISLRWFDMVCYQWHPMTMKQKNTYKNSIIWYHLYLLVMLVYIDHHLSNLSIITKKWIQEIYIEMLNWFIPLQSTSMGNSWKFIESSWCRPPAEVQTLLAVPEFEHPGNERRSLKNGHARHLQWHHW